MARPAPHMTGADGTSSSVAILGLAAFAAGRDDPAESLTHFPRNFQHRQGGTGRTHVGEL